MDRARREDLDQPLQYPCRFVRNSQGQPVIDRLFNTVSLLDVYMGKAGVPSDAVQWDIDNPNNLELRMPGALVPSTPGPMTCYNSKPYTP